MKWNPEQLKAIQTTGRHVLVSASAGAGKTAVLVERLVKRCLTDRVELDQVLAMTFTEAAANEMKKRLSMRLNEEYLKPSTDTTYIKRQLVLLQNAKISTIHSFCLDLIKKHADAIGLDPNFANTILEDGQLKKAKRDAFELCLSRWFTMNPEVTLFLTQYFSPRSESFSEFQNTVFSIINTANSSTDDAMWMERAQKNCARLKTQDDLSPECLSTFLAACRLDANIQLQTCNDCARIIEITDPTNEKILNSLEIKKEFIQDALLVLENESIDDFVAAFRRSLSKDLAPNGKNIDYTATRKLLSDHGKKCIEKYPDFETLRNDSNKMSDFASALLGFTKDVSAEWVKAKHKLQGINFDDMERYAYHILLADNSRIAKEYKHSLKEILVDEFQDTSEIQNEILCLLSNGSNIFRVGDVKQSIYRFRRAKPEIMRSLMGDPNIEQISLAYNYRSNHSIVNYTNDLFSKLMNVSGCKDTYRNCDFVQAGRPEQKSTDSPVEFYTINVEELDDDVSGKIAKARFIAQKIIQMRKSTEFKNFSDYVILAKSHADKNLLKQVFNECNIPYSIDAKEGFYQSTCCQIVTSMLRCINGHDDIAFVAALTSVLYGVTDDELATYKLNYSSIYEACIQTNHPIIQDIKDCRAYYATHDLCLLLNKIASINHFVNEKLDKQQRTNFDYLFQKASSFQSKSTSLSLFLEQIDLNLDEKSDEAVSLGPEEDVVRAITIHHSKGLQYKVVFYWSTSMNKLQDKLDSVLIDPELGLGLYAFNLPYRERRSTFQRIAIEHKINLDDLEETIRVLYVALTRAESKLILVDTLKREVHPTSIELSLLNQRKGTSHLILSALSTQGNFIIHHVPELTAFTEEKKARCSLPFSKQYELHEPKIQSLSPSSTENYFIPHLNLNASLTQRGTSIHEWIEKLPNRSWVESDFNGSLLSSEDIIKCINFSHHPRYLHCLSKTIKKEFSFSTLVDHQLIQGSFDFIAYDDTSCILIDFKSDKNVDAEALKKRYTQQIEAYKLAIHALFPSLPCEAYLYSLDNELLIAM